MCCVCGESVCTLERVVTGPLLFHAEPQISLSSKKSNFIDPLSSILISFLQIIKSFSKRSVLIIPVAASSCSDIELIQNIK